MKYLTVLIIAIGLAAGVVWGYSVHPLITKTCLSISSLFLNIGVWMAYGRNVGLIFSACSMFLGLIASSLLNCFGLN